MSKLSQKRKKDVPREDFPEEEDEYSETEQDREPSKQSKDSESINHNTKIIIQGQVVSINKNGNKRICKVDNGTRTYLCETDYSRFIEYGDYISFEHDPNREDNGRIQRIGIQKGKQIYIIPDGIENCNIIIPEGDEAVINAAILVFNGHNSIYDKVIDEITEAAALDGLSISEFMYESCEDRVLDPHRNKFNTWWLGKRAMRRLWHLGLKNKQIEEFKEIMKCNSGKLYDIITADPLKVYCLDLALAITISKIYGKSYTPEYLMLARIARFIYSVSAEGNHVCLGSKDITNMFPDFQKYRERLLAEYEIVYKMRRYYLTYNWEVTDGLANNLCNLIRKKLRTRDTTIVPEFSGVKKLDDTQKNAVNLAINKCISLIIGGAGRGKTTIIREIVHNLSIRKVKYMLCGFTGKSVVCIRKAISNSDNRVQLRDRTMTLHMLLKKSTISIEHLIIDEISMVHHALLYEVLKAHPELRSLTLIGDHNQLQPLKWGNTLQQLMLLAEKDECPFQIPVIKLQKNYRARAKIMTFDKDGNLMPTEVCKLQRGRIDDVVRAYMDLVNQGIGTRDIIILAPFNKDVDQINIKCQEELGNRIFLEDKRGRRFAEGDKVILTKNNDTIEQMNGDIGTILEVNRNTGELHVEFADKTEVYTLSKNGQNTEYRFHGDGMNTMTTDVLNLAHCITIHKSQGSEWLYVIVYIPFGVKKEGFFNFNMIYTAISRTVSVVTIIGDLSDLQTYLNKERPPLVDSLCEIIYSKLTECVE